MQNLKQLRHGFVVLSLLSMAHAYAGVSYTDEMSVEFGEFYDNSSSYQDLLSVNTPHNNYAEVTIIGSSGSEIDIEQNHYGQGQNKAKVVQHSSYSSKAVINQAGSNNIGMIEQQGTNNFAYLEQTGRHHNSYISQDGNDNVAVLSQCSGWNCSSNYGSDISIVQTNDSNEAYIFDKGGSSYGVEQDGNDSIVIISSMSRGIYVRQ
ncbi:curlin subunit CsgB [Vibrio scophthalmi]|uniref:curlin subunit CsgB n=1 Tax=Vibrio scophthalmi TaxID=45658 RepID=UPI002FF1961C